MTCSTCGRDNPAHLTFCQECGQRLGPRIAPPTPPIGLSGHEAYGATPEPRLAQDTRAMPARGATALGMMAAASGGPSPAGPAPFPPPAAAPPPAPLGAAAERRCKVCETLNEPNLRYCTSCGSTLEPAPARSSAGAPPFPQPAPAIAPARVVDLGPSADAHRTCGRCRGVTDAAAQFCKFCGNALSEAKGPTPAPPPTAEARSNGAHAEAPPAGRGPTAPIALAPAPQRLDATRAPAPALAPVAATPSRAPAPARGRLVVIAKSGVDGPSYPFGDLLDVGRAEGNVVVAEDPYLSPRHARLTWTDGKLVLRDLASANGVYLRLAASRDMTGRRASEGAEVAVPLASQDLVLVGQQVLRFEILAEAEGGLGPAEEHGTLLFGSPAAPRYARLCQRTVEGITRDVYYIRKAETVLGRESGDVVFTEDPFLSRRHAAIRLLLRDGATAGARPSSGELRFALVDLGSSNGTFLRIRGDVELAPGDHFRVGQQLFRVDFDGVR